MTRPVAPSPDEVRRAALRVLAAAGPEERMQLLRDAVAVRAMLREYRRATGDDGRGPLPCRPGCPPPLL